MCFLCFPTPAVTCDSFLSVFKPRCCILFLFCHSLLCLLGFGSLLCLPLSSRLSNCKGLPKSDCLQTSLDSSVSGKCTSSEYFQRQFLEELSKCPESHSYKSTQTSPTFHQQSLICRVLATRCISLPNLRQLKAAAMTDCSYTARENICTWCSTLWKPDEHITRNYTWQLSPTPMTWKMLILQNKTNKHDDWSSIIFDWKCEKQTSMGRLSHVFYFPFYLWFLWVFTCAEAQTSD